MKKLLQILLSVCIVSAMPLATAWGFGALVGPDGATISAEAARVIIARGAETVQLVAQIRPDGAPAAFVWLLAVPNVPNAVENGVRVEGFSAEAFDALDLRTRPRLSGVCGEAPTGQSHEPTQRFESGQIEALPSRIFTATEIEDGDLHRYLESVGTTVDASLEATITTMIDQNFMFIAVRVEAGDAVNPIVSITAPLAADASLRLALRPMTHTAGGGVSDLTLWVLADERVSMLARREVDFEAVEFVSDTQTNYTEAVDASLALVQTQGAVTEYAGGVEIYTDASVNGLVTTSGATFLTRLRTRMTAPALEANPAVSLRFDGVEPFGRAHEVTGFLCEQPSADAGTEPSVDAGTEPSADAGTEPSADGGVDEPAAESGGGGGCSVTRGSSPLSFAALMGFMALGLAARRR